VIQVIGKRILALRRARGLSQARLGALAGITKEAVYLIEKGRKPCARAVVIGRLAAALHTTSDYLLGLSDDPFPPPKVDRGVEPARLARLVPLLEPLAHLSLRRRKHAIDTLQTFLEQARGLGPERSVEAWLRLVEPAPDAGDGQERRGGGSG